MYYSYSVDLVVEALEYLRNEMRNVPILCEVLEQVESLLQQDKTKIKLCCPPTLWKLIRKAIKMMANGGMEKIRPYFQRFLKGKALSDSIYLQLLSCTDLLMGSPE